MVYDLSNVSYDHDAAMGSLREFNAMAEQSMESSRVFKPMDVEDTARSQDYKPTFKSKKMKLEKDGVKGKVQEDLLSFQS